MDLRHHKEELKRKKKSLPFLPTMRSQPLGRKRGMRGIE
jgi:hypothetical protein